MLHHGPFSEGKAARLVGDGIKHNPYEAIRYDDAIYGEYWSDWESGWVAAAKARVKEALPRIVKTLMPPCPDCGLIDCMCPRRTCSCGQCKTCRMQKETRCK